jgi:hypothetical protein
VRVSSRWSMTEVVSEANQPSGLTMASTGMESSGKWGVVSRGVKSNLLGRSSAQASKESW